MLALSTVDSEVAVIAILCHQGRCLFLNRKTPPFNWCPPGGRLKLGEDCVAGIKREVFEETGIQAKVLLPVTTWQGMHVDKKIFSVTFVCEAEKEQVVLSDEHSDFCWIKIENLGSRPLKDFQREIDTDFDTKSWPQFIELAKKHFSNPDLK